MDEHLKNGRFFIAKQCKGNEICACCGEQRAEKPLAKVLKNTFTEINQLVKAPSDFICESCEKIYLSSDMRFKCIYSATMHSYEVIQRTDVIEKICNPQKQWVLSVPYSFKKHHWLYAGLSDEHHAYIGTDDRTVYFSYDKHNISYIVEQIQDLVTYGVPRAEIISGNYSVFSLDKYRFIPIYEEHIQPLRSCGLVELIVKFTPALKEKLVYKSEVENPMLTQSEFDAVNFLSSIASNSQYRIENGIQFWQGFFERRVNRFKNFEATIFASKLSESVGASQGIYIDMLTQKSNEELESMMKEIREKTHILISIVYSERNKNK